MSVKEDIQESSIRKGLQELKQFQFDSAKEEYKLKRQELWNLDSKIYWILSINFILFGLFAKFGSFPEEFYGKLFFIAGYLLIGASCFYLINALNPSKFKVLGLDFHNSNSLLKEVDVTLIQLRESYNQLKKYNESKCYRIQNAIFLTLLSLIIFGLINLGGYFKW